MNREDDLAEYDELNIEEQKKPDLLSTAYFSDFLLRDELNKAITEVQFEHPSPVQQQCIPKAILGADILCQAKSGTGKTAVFVLASLNQMNVIEKETSVLVICHTKELAIQIKNEFLRFVTHFNNGDKLNKITVDAFYGGNPVDEDITKLQNGLPTIFIGTPGRTLDLLNRRVVYFRHVKHFIVDEVDECISELGKRYDIQRILYNTPLNKQTMMFTATLSDETKKDCLKFLRDPHIVLVGEESKLTLHGLQQSYCYTKENDKMTILEKIISNVKYTQMVIFVRDKFRAKFLADNLRRKNIPASEIHSGMHTNQRMEKYKRFKDVQDRVLVTTNLMARGIDFQDVNVVVNYDMPECAETYLHRVGRAGRFETKGSAFTFVESVADTEVLNNVQSRFDVSIKVLEL